MMTEAGHLEAAIAVLEAQRASLGDAAADAAISSLRERISKLRADAAPVPAMQRRQVTVLFADIVDSTSMGEKLDAEDVVHVMSEGLARFAAAVRAHHEQQQAQHGQRVPLMAQKFHDGSYPRSGRAGQKRSAGDLAY